MPLRRLPSLLMLITLCSISLPLLADVAPQPLMTGGYNPQPRTAVPVAMLWEEVDLTISKEKNAVVAVFALKNQSDVETSFEVGFPSYFEIDLEEFKLMIDGKQQLTELKREGQKDWRGNERFTYWMVWNMTFKPQQEQRVEVRYWVKPAVRARGMPPELAREIEESSSGYVLHTGSGWAGNIGKATIRLHYTESVQKKHLTRLWPDNPKNKMVWTYDPKTQIDTLVLEQFEPHPGWDIQYAFKFVNEAQKTERLAQAMAENQLTYPGLWYLEGLVARSKLQEIAGQDRQTQLLTVRKRMVPPLGPVFKDDPESYYDRCHNEEVYRVVLAHYQKEKNGEAVKSLAQSYRDLLAHLLKRDEAKYQAAKNRSPFGQYEKTFLAGYEKRQNELAGLAKLLAE